MAINDDEARRVGRYVQIVAARLPIELQSQLARQEVAKLEGQVLVPILFGIGMAGALGRAGLLFAPKDAAEVHAHAAKEGTAAAAAAVHLSSSSKRLGCSARPVTV